MKIAVIVITYNDDYKFSEWCKWYEEYKDQVALYVIVDNNSCLEYKEQVQSYFKDAHFIWRESNGGCTSAYNDGIRYALSLPEITHIALVGNDIRLSDNCLIRCAELLNVDPKLGMISPVLLNENSSIVGDYGCGISEDLSMLPFGKGLNVNELGVSLRYCDALTGGINISKRSFYETVGLQDENLFMYSDEVDMALRAKHHGIKMAATSEVKAWHQHINSPIVVKRHPYSAFLIARNKVYLAYKHYGKEKAHKVYHDFFYSGLKNYLLSILKLDFEKAQFFRWRMIGAKKGMKRDMRQNKYSHL